jgi:hypothetical protein
MISINPMRTSLLGSKTDCGVTADSASPFRASTAVGPRPAVVESVRASKAVSSKRHWRGF